MKLKEEGFVEAPAFVLLLLLSMMLAAQAFIWQKRRSQLREHHLQVLCMKESLIKTSKLIKRVHTLNQMLAAGKVGQSIAILFPGKGWLMALKWERVKKVLKTLQETAYWDVQKDYLTMKAKGCNLPYRLFLTPLKHKAFFERKLDQTILRKTEEELTFKTPLTKYLLKWKISSSLDPKLNWSIR